MYITFIVDPKVILSYKTSAIYSFQQIALKHIDIHSQKKWTSTLMLYHISMHLLKMDPVTNVKPEITTISSRKETWKNICDHWLGKNFLEHKKAGHIKDKK